MEKTDFGKDIYRINIWRLTMEVMENDIKGTKQDDNMNKI